MNGRILTIIVLTLISVLFIGLNAFMELAVILVAVISYFIFKEKIAEARW